MPTVGSYDQLTSSGLLVPWHVRRTFPLESQTNEKLEWTVSDWWLSRELKASSSASVLFVTVKGTIISWRRGLVTEFKSLAAATEKGIAQESLQKSAQLQSYSCKSGWMNWERRSSDCGPIPFCSSALSILYFFSCETALVSIHPSVCLSVWGTVHRCHFIVSDVQIMVVIFVYIAKWSACLVEHSSPHVKILYFFLW